jgi:hypothetical protein
MAVTGDKPAPYMVASPSDARASMPEGLSTMAAAHIGKPMWTLADAQQSPTAVFLTLGAVPSNHRLRLPTSNYRRARASADFQ